MAGLADEIFQRGAGQQRHHEVGLLLAVFLKFSNVEDLNDVGMAHGREHIALFVEQLQRSGIRNIKDGLDRDFTAHYGVIGPINQAHPALAKDLPDLIAACQFSRGRGYLHGAPRGWDSSILIDLAEKSTTGRSRTFRSEEHTSELQSRENL